MRALTLYNLLMLAACGALGAWAYSETRQPLPPLPEQGPVTAMIETAAGTPSPPPAAFRMPPKNTYAQLVRRPPFSQSRRPPRAKPAPVPVVAETPAAPAATPQPVAEPRATLVGIVINSQKSIAMVRQPGAEEVLRLAKGEKLEDWLVEGVLPDRLLLSHGDKLLELELTEAAQETLRQSTGRPPARARRP